MPSRPSVFRTSHYVEPEARRRDEDVRRGSARERGYGGRWQKARLTYLRRHPLCLGCEAVGRVEASCIVDHVIPHRGDQALFWDTNNWQACCAWHHDVVKQRLERRWASGALPASDLRLDSDVAITETRAMRTDSA